MPSRDARPSDFDEVDLRLKTIRTYIWPALLTCACCLTYYGLTWSHPHRPFLASTAVGAALATLPLLWLPMERVVRGRLYDPFFLGWLGTLIVIIFVASAVDGGITSPLVALFFIPLVGASLSAPVRSTLLVGGLVLSCYLGLLAFSTHVPGPSVFIVSSTLVITSWICAWQASIRDSQRRWLAGLSRTDMLTGALNRRGFEERVDAELARAQREQGSVSLVVVDLDHFKVLNDTEGHHAGDELLRWVSETITRELRSSDAVGRWGGDEFAVLLASGDPDPAATVERLLTQLGERTPACAGVATFPIDGDDQASLFQHADETLYQHKHGRPATTAVTQRALSWATDLASAADQRMGVTHTHSHAVSEHAAGIARVLGWEEPTLGLLRLAAELHDIGKTVVPVRILRDPGRLSEADWEEMRKHAVAGASLAGRVEGLEVIVPWIRHSHERVDGSGYPDRLSGDQIPLASRVILVADAYDAMTSDRPYRAALTREQACQELALHSGTQFDPRCVDALVRYLAAQSLGPRQEPQGSVY